MISFRFYVVSVMAVFLALAIGIVVGSTVIDRAIVDTLRDRVEAVRENLDDRQEANDRLNEQLGQAQEFVEDSAAFSVQDRLSDSVTVIITDEGVDSGPVERAEELLVEAGTTVRGILTIDGSWNLEDTERRAALAEAIDLDAESTVEDLQARAASLLVTDLSSSVEVVDDDTGALDQIAELDLVRYEQVDDVVVAEDEEVLFLVVSGPESDVGSSAHTEHFAVSAASAGGVVVAEVWSESEDGPERADSLAAILGSPTLSGQISTVDALDLVQGPTTVVLALAATMAGDVGHFGVGDGADPSAPPPPDDS